ncbi:hypothetical protein HDE_09143 [Halotydeus destructor]|nr:hypothetical protein HDE_09143 [Halotydeus destructor]
MVLPVLISMVMRSFIVSGQNCFGGIETFEKVAMTQVAPHISPAGVLLHQQDQALTRDCVNLCKQHPLCLSFGLDYVGFKCDAYEVNSQSSQQLADLVVSNNSNYFEKVCYRGVSRDDYERMCGHERLWTFERVRGAILEGFERLQLNYIQSRSECAKACLMEATFTCRSADYDDITKMCRLSQENRRTQPQAFRLVPDSNREYLENQCVSSARTLTTLSTGRLALQHGPQAVSGPDKPTWEQASVSCTKAEMVLTINFDSAFRGRVYAKGSPDHCYVLGAGQTQLQFAIPLDPRCGTRAEGPNAYANDVVIQQHAAIMRDSDLHIRVLCSFETIDQTVTASDPAPVGHRKSHLFSDHAEKWRDNIARSRVYVPSSEPIANPTTVSSTAPQPAIVMRVIGPAGSKDSQVVGLGDMLTLIIELHDPNLTPMGIFARNVYAKSASGESWLLIDTHGCPTDASVFPAMKPVGNGNKALISTFKAFKFPSTGTVNFEAQDMKRDFVFTESLPSGEFGTKETTPATIKSHMLSNEMQEVVVETTPHSEALTANDTKKFARSASHATDQNNMSTPTAAHFMASFESTNGSSDTSVSYRQMSPYPANTYQQGYHQPSYNQPPNQYGSQPPGYGQGYYPGAYTPTFGGPNYGPPGYTPNYQHPNSWASRTSPDVPTKVNFTYGGTSWTSPGQDQNRYGNDPMRASGQGTHGVRELPPPTVLSAPSPAGQPSNPFSAGPPGSNPQVVTGQLGGPPSSGNNQAASPMFTVQSSRPLPAKEKGKFKPPRPLPRPKGANPGTLHTSITVKEKDGDEQEQSGNWNIERRARNPSKQELNGCNTGPAILYTAIVVTLLHCTILMGGYLYYRRFIGYPKSSSASAKLLRPQSFTNDESHVVGSLGHHHGGHTMTRNGPPFQSDPRNIRSNVPQGSTTSTNNSNVFYGQGTFRESPRDHPGNNFRSLYTGHFGSPP